MDQGEPTDGVIVPSRGWLSPARALLLLLGAVVGGVMLSLALGSSAAHAAEGNGTPSDPNPLTSATHSLTSTVVSTASDAVAKTASTTARTGIPAVQQVVKQTLDASAATVVTATPGVAPVVVPAVASVEATLAGTLSATAWTVQQLTAPAAGALDPFALAGTISSQASAAVAVGHSSAAVDSHPGGNAISAALPAALGGSTDNAALPGSLASSSASAAPAALGVLFAAFAVVLLTARRRIIQAAVPPSPVFDTDTSPA